MILKTVIFFAFAIHQYPSLAVTLYLVIIGVETGMDNEPSRRGPRVKVCVRMCVPICLLAFCPPACLPATNCLLPCLAVISDTCPCPRKSSAVVQRLVHCSRSRCQSVSARSCKANTIFRGRYLFDLLSSETLQRVMNCQFLMWH